MVKHRETQKMFEVLAFLIFSFRNMYQAGLKNILKRQDYERLSMPASQEL